MPRTSQRAAYAVALIALLLLLWLSLGVGIIGADGDPANRMYLGVIGIGVAGSLVARFRPGGMALTMVAMGVAQALVAAIAVVLGLGQPWSGPAEVLLLNAFFVAMFGVSAWLFRRAARQP